MYLQDQIQMLIDRVHELNEEVEKNERVIRRLEFLNEQIQEVIDELESCVENFKLIDEESQDNLTIFDSRE